MHAADCLTVGLLIVHAMCDVYQAVSDTVKHIVVTVIASAGLYIAAGGPIAPDRINTSSAFSEEPSLFSILLVVQ